MKALKSSNTCVGGAVKSSTFIRTKHNSEEKEGTVCVKLRVHLVHQAVNRYTFASWYWSLSQSEVDGCITRILNWYLVHSQWNVLGHLNEMLLIHYSDFKTHPKNTTSTAVFFFFPLRGLHPLCSWLNIWVYCWRPQPRPSQVFKVSILCTVFIGPTYGRGGIKCGNRQVNSY